MKVKHLVGAFLCVLGCYACSSPKTEVQSPDGHIKMTLTVDENGKPFYNVSVDDSLLIENSAMGFTAANGIILGEGFQVKNTTFSSEDETWTQPWGENKKNRNHYNEMAVNLTNEDHVQLTLRFRAARMSSRPHFFASAATRAMPISAQPLPVAQRRRRTNLPVPTS